MNWAKTEQILKIGEKFWIKELKHWWLIEENFMEEFILEDLGEFQWFGLFLKKGRRMKSFEHLGDFSEIGRLDL